MACSHAAVAQLLGPIMGANHDSAAFVAEFLEHEKSVLSTLGIVANFVIAHFEVMGGLGVINAEMLAFAPRVKVNGHLRDPFDIVQYGVPYLLTDLMGLVKRKILVDRRMQFDIQAPARPSRSDIVDVARTFDLVGGLFDAIENFGID